MEETVQENEMAIDQSGLESVEDGLQQYLDQLYVRVTGLEGAEKSSRFFVTTFFAGLSVDQVCFCLEYAEILRGTGQAIVRFSCPEHANAALTYSNKDGKKILVKRSNKREWDEGVHEAISLHWECRCLQAQEKRWFVRFINLPYSISEEELKYFIGKPERSDITFVLHKDNFSAKGAFVVLYTEEDAIKSLELHKWTLNDLTVLVYPCPTVESEPTLTLQVFEKDETASEKTLKEGSELRCTHERKEWECIEDPQKRWFVRFSNLPYSMQERDLKYFIGKPERSDITFVVDEENFNTREAFVVLYTSEDADKCLKLHKSILNGHLVSVFPSSKRSFKKSRQEFKKTREKTIKERSELRCIYARNFPAHVTKFDVKQFFAEFEVNLEDIFLLYDDSGQAMGEAFVKFSTEQEAMLAESLHRRTFSGTEILLLRITEEQVNGFHGARK